METIPEQTVTTLPTRPRQIAPRRGLENTAWKWMRYSAFLLIPLTWGHVILQDVIVGVHAMDLNYVAMRWASFGWRAYDAALLAFAFAHGMNGFRQVIEEYLPTVRARQVAGWVLFAGWLLISAIGTIALIGGVRTPAS